MLYGLRTLRKNPAFALTALLTLALGIGANTAIFTMVHAVLLKPLDYRDPDRLMHVSGGSTATRFEEMKTAARSFTELGAFAVGKENVTLSHADGPEALNGARVSANFLQPSGCRAGPGAQLSSGGRQAWWSSGSHDQRGVVAAPFWG